MNLCEFYNKRFSLKGECLLDKKKFCLTIVETDSNRKAVKTVQYYLDLSAGVLLFEDIISERFWRSAIRYPEKQFREQKDSRGTYRDLLIRQDGRISIKEGSDGLLFNLTPFQLASLANSLLSYVKAAQLAYALKK